MFRFKNLRLLLLILLACFYIHKVEASSNESDSDIRSINGSVLSIDLIDFSFIIKSDSGEIVLYTDTNTLFQQLKSLGELAKEDQVLSVFKKQDSSNLAISIKKSTLSKAIIDIQDSATLDKSIDTLQTLKPVPDNPIQKDSIISK